MSLNRIQPFRVSASHPTTSHPFPHAHVLTQSPRRPPPHLISCLAPSQSHLTTTRIPNPLH
ncbi:hypothetical protein BDP81DRAFT_441975 [Colletotrichum phormii]|uniref:Uncharacterized protein n=1 Tax=Colletotrichum phormii TaxID=359342 RepID=A0AAI9ZDF4_9PEZI|nr:uncharacterized protein BDP81DRAFT_441975 [Colletotrichum phormii]KAK1622168.1 hypothetical protein BDP81DRAFT_441975 [Colletotrichum phormii]